MMAFNARWGYEAELNHGVLRNEGILCLIIRLRVGVVVIGWGKRCKTIAAVVAAELMAELSVVVVLVAV